MEQSRLFKIVYHLLENGKSTAPELAEKFEVSIRTIYRDLDAISATGIPIYATQGKGGGISLLDDYVLEKSLFSEKEKELPPREKKQTNYFQSYPHSFKQKAQIG